MDLNKILLTGRLGRDPEGRFTAQGKQLAGLSLAVSGKKDEKPTWFSCTAWEKTAEFALANLHKGDRVLIEGRLSFNNVEGENGTKQFVNINVSLLLAMGGKNGNGHTADAEAGTVGLAETQQEDIPF